MKTKQLKRKESIERATVFFQRNNPKASRETLTEYLYKFASEIEIDQFMSKLHTSQ